MLSWSLLSLSRSDWLCLLWMQVNNVCQRLNHISRFNGCIFVMCIIVFANVRLSVIYWSTNRCWKRILSLIINLEAVCMYPSWHWLPQQWLTCFPKNIIHIYVVYIYIIKFYIVITYSLKNLKMHVPNQTSSRLFNSVDELEFELIWPRSKGHHFIFT